MLAIPSQASISYMGHLQDWGDTAWISQGQICGTVANLGALKPLNLELTRVIFSFGLNPIGDKPANVIS